MSQQETKQILQFLNAHPGQYTAAELREFLGVPRREKDRFVQNLELLVRDGALNLISKKRFSLQAEADLGELIGEPKTQTLPPRGSWVPPEGGDSSANRETRRKAGGRDGKRGDKRGAKERGGRRGRSNSNTLRQGVLEQSGDRWFVRDSMDSSLCVPVEGTGAEVSAVVAAVGSHAEKSGAVGKPQVWFELIQDPRRDGYLARIAVGSDGEMTFAESAKLFIQRCKLKPVFPALVQQQVKELVEAHRLEREGREDLRELETLCIDPKGARDHDDAASVIQREDGMWDLWVHIADVSTFVEDNTALDVEARERAYTQYLPWTAVPMLPEELSADVCSLRAGQDRLAFSCQMTFSSAGILKEYRFVKTIICVDEFVIYEDALAKADQKGPFQRLRTLARKLRAQRVKDGLLELEMPEAKVGFDEAGKPARVEQRTTIESMSWIEECMLAANRCCAHFMRTNKLPGLYRVHGAPAAADIRELAGTEPTLFVNTGFNPATLKDLQSGIAVQPRLFALYQKLVLNAGADINRKRTVLRSMQKAQYSPEPMGHFALNWMDYAHFTSPIRRYADLWCHRMMTRALEGKKVKKFHGLDDMAGWLSDREIAVMKIERQAVRLCGAFIAKDHLGEVFEARVTGIIEWGLFLELPSIGVEGALRFETMGDWFEYDPQREIALGRRNRRIIQRGDAFNITLARVDLERGEIDLMPAPDDAEVPEANRIPAKGVVMTPAAVGTLVESGPTAGVSPDAPEKAPAKSAAKPVEKGVKATAAKAGAKVAGKAPAKNAAKEPAAKAKPVAKAAPAKKGIRIAAEKPAAEKPAAKKPVVATKKPTAKEPAVTKPAVRKSTRKPPVDPE